MKFCCKTSYSFPKQYQRSRAIFKDRVRILGFQFSVHSLARPSIHMSVRSQLTSILAFKSIQITYSLKPLHPWFSNFTRGMIRLQAFRKRKFSLVENPRWPPVLKNSKTNEINFVYRRTGYFWLKFCMDHKWDLGVHHY